MLTGRFLWAGLPEDIIYNNKGGSIL